VSLKLSKQAQSKLLVKRESKKGAGLRGNCPDPDQGPSAEAHPEAHPDADPHPPPRDPDPDPYPDADSDP
jgi:hypothetical protein